MRSGDLKRKRAQLCLASLGGVHVALKVQANVGHRAALAGFAPPHSAVVLFESCHLGVACFLDF